MIVEWSLGSKKVDIKKLVIENLGEDKGKQLLEKTGPKFLQHADENENSLSLGVSALKKLLDKLSEKNSIGKNIIKGTIIYLVVALISVLIFGRIAATVLSSVGGAV